MSETPNARSTEELPARGSRSSRNAVLLSRTSSRRLAHATSNSSHPNVDVDHQWNENVKECWICFATDEEEPDGFWTQPCNCRGSTKWVHQACLQHWVDARQKDNRDAKIACPQCKTEYLIYYPSANAFVLILDKADAMIYRLCPFITAGVIVGTLYWTAFTFGLVTIIQVVDEPVKFIEKLDPSVLLTVLPAIPINLIVFKLIPWEENLLVFLREVSPSLPVLNYVLPSPVVNESGAIQAAEPETRSGTRIFTSAILLPSISVVVGNAFFSQIESGVQRSIAGGLAFIAVSGVIKMYHRQQVYKRLSKRRILDYTEENARIFGLD